MKGRFRTTSTFVTLIVLFTNVDLRNKMASTKKKRVDEDEMEDDELVDEDEDVDDEDNESDEEEEAMDQEVQLDFEARVPDDSDFGGIRTLLQQVYLKANINLSELTDTIISQNYIGSVMKQPYNPEVDDDDDDDDMDSDDSVLALTTVVNITERKSLDCVKQLKAMLEEKCKQCAAAQSEKFKKLLNDPDHQVGYLVSERFLNLPPSLAVPMFEALMKEMEKAKQKKMKYEFSHYLMVCKTFEMKAAHNVRQLFYSNSEEELFQEASDLCFRYSVAHERDSGVEKWSSEDGMEPFRNVILFSADKLPTVLEKLKEEVAKT